MQKCLANMQSFQIKFEVESNREVNKASWSMLHSFVIYKGKPCNKINTNKICSKT